MKDELDDCITTLTALDEALARLRNKLESGRAAQVSGSLSEPAPEAATPSTQDSSASGTTGTAGASVTEPLAKKRKLEPAQDYADLRRSSDVKKAKRLVTARENSIKAVQKLLDKEMAAKSPTVAEKTGGIH